MRLKCLRLVAPPEHNPGKSDLGRAIDRVRTSAKIQLKVFACVLVAMMVLGSTPRAFGESGSVVYTFGSASSQNQSNYTLYYSVPPVVQAGVKTNMTFFVYVTSLSGWKIQSQRQILQVIVNTPSKQVTTQKVQNDVILYQGARWGPFNVTLDLNASQAGLSSGQVANATIFASLVVYEQYDNPVYPFLVDSGTTLQLTSVQIAATNGSTSPSGDRVLPSLAVGAAVIVILTGVALATRKREPPGMAVQGL